MQDHVLSESSAGTLAEARLLPLPVPFSGGSASTLFVEEKTAKLSSSGMNLHAPSITLAPVTAREVDTPVGGSTESTTTTAIGGSVGWAMVDLVKLREGCEAGDVKSLDRMQKRGVDGDEGGEHGKRSSKHHGKKKYDDELVAPPERLAQINRARYTSSQNLFQPLGTSCNIWNSGSEAVQLAPLSRMSSLTKESVEEGPLLYRPEASSESTWLSLTILGMSVLHADTYVVHPFVRIWLVNSVTGKNLLESGYRVAPFGLTHPVDLRLRGTRAPWWGAGITFKVESRVVNTASSNAMLLLEVLEMGGETIHGFSLRRDGLYPICWGFLKLHDIHGQLNTRDRLHLQMFPFPQRASCWTKLMQLLPSFCLPYSSSFSSEAAWTEDESESPALIHSDNNNNNNIANVSQGIFFSNDVPPEVFFVYKNARNRKVPYSVGMVLSLKKSDKEVCYSNEITLLPYEEQLMNQMSIPDELRPKSGARSSLSLSITRQGGRSNRSVSLVNASALLQSYFREKDERVVPPTTVLQRIQVKGKVTCVAFSSRTVLLAMGVTNGFDHVIQLRRGLTSENTLIRVFRGHVGHIHHVVFYKDGNLLLSCSSDKTVRVWRCDVHAPLMGKVNDIETSYLCTLPHSFPVYDCIFYSKHIITCGYDPSLFVWSYNKAPSCKSEEHCNSDNILKESSKENRRTILESSNMAVEGSNFSVGGDSVVVGRLVHMTSGDEEAVIYSIAASRMNRVWSVDALGNVLVWRVLHEKMKDDKYVWQISVRHRFKCHGATSVEVCGGTALVKCSKSPVVYLFDTSAYTLLHEITLDHLPCVPPLTLLPDGEAIVAGTHDGKLLCWECSSAALCTPRDGYAKAKVPFPISHIVWSRDQQLCVVLGTEGDVGYVNSDRDTRLTVAALIGTPRTTESVILSRNPRAQEFFRARFADELTSQRSQRNFSGVGGGGSSGFRIEVDKGKQLSGVSAVSHGNLSRDKKTRMDQIIGLWKGLVSQHRHVKPMDASNPQVDPAVVYIADEK